MLGLNKLFSIVVLSALVITLFISYNSFNSLSDEIANIAVVMSKPSLKPTFIPTPIVWTGKIHWGMTYGRLLFENLNPDAEYKYFIAEPDDVMEDDVYRRSPTTMNIRDTDTVKITGVVADACYWDFGVDDTNYKGCVPWVEIDKVEIIK